MVTLRTTDGVRLDAWHDPGDVRLAVVIAHGFTGSWRQPAVRRVAAVLNPHAQAVELATGAAARTAPPPGADLPPGAWLAPGVVSFDFRGHGRSGGASTVGDLEVLDLRAAVDWALAYGYRRVVTLGFSMGAAVAIRHAALYRGVAAIAAVSGPSRWYYRGTPPMRRLHWMVQWPLGRLIGRIAMGTRIASGGWRPPLPEAPFEVAGRISPVPLLVVHGDADAYFPVEHAEKLYAAAAEPKELWIEPGFGHAENAASGELLGRIRTWLIQASGAGEGPVEP